VLAVSAAAFAALYRRADADRRKDLEVEAGKAMLQVIVVSLGGSIVVAIIKDFEERRKAWLTKRDLQRKAWLDDGGGSIGTNTYDELLQEISDIQLGLERYKRQAADGERVAQERERDLARGHGGGAVHQVMRR
jgi:hypothetical protein